MLHPYMALHDEAHSSIISICSIEGHFAFRIHCSTMYDTGLLLYIMDRNALAAIMCTNGVGGHYLFRCDETASCEDIRRLSDFHKKQFLVKPLN